MQYLIWDGEDFDLDRYFQSAHEMLLGYLRGCGANGGERAGPGSR